MTDLHLVALSGSKEDEQKTASLEHVLREHAARSIYCGKVECTPNTSETELIAYGVYILSKLIEQKGPGVIHDWIREMEGKLSGLNISCDRESYKSIIKAEQDAHNARIKLFFETSNDPASGLKTKW
jgi:hypothetical protein